MAVDNQDTRSMRRDGRQNVRGVDEREADAITQAAERRNRILHDLMMKQNDPGVPRRISQERLERLHLQGIHDADGIGERKVAGSIRIEKNEPVAIFGRRGLNQREDCIPDFRDLPASAYGAMLRKRAQQLRAFAFAQVVLERRSQSAGHVVNQTGAAALNGIKSQNEAELSQRLS